MNRLVLVELLYVSPWSELPKVISNKDHPHNEWYSKRVTNEASVFITFAKNSLLSDNKQLFVGFVVAMFTQ